MEDSFASLTGLQCLWLPSAFSPDSALIVVANWGGLTLPVSLSIGSPKMALSFCYESPFEVVLKGDPQENRSLINGLFLLFACFFLGGGKFPERKAHPKRPFFA